MKKYTKKQQEYINKLLATIDGLVIVIGALEDLAAADAKMIAAAVESVEWLEETVATQSVLIDEYAARDEELRRVIRALAAAV